MSVEVDLQYCAVNFFFFNGAESRTAPCQREITLAGGGIVLRQSYLFISSGVYNGLGGFDLFLPLLFLLGREIT